MLPPYQALCEAESCPKDAKDSSSLEEDLSVQFGGPRMERTLTVGLSDSHSTNVFRVPLSPQALFLVLGMQ